MRKIWNLLLIFGCAAALLFGGTQAFAEELAPNAAEELSESEAFGEGDVPESEELFAGYVEKVFYESVYPDAYNYANTGEWRLQGAEREMYRQVKAFIKKVAAGEQRQTVVPLQITLEWKSDTPLTRDNYKEFADKKYAETFDRKKVLQMLLFDCPFEMFWFDGTSGWQSYSRTIFVDEYTVRKELTKLEMSVAQEYQGAGGVYDFNTSLIGMVHNARNNAENIVNSNTGKTRYEKYLAYKNTICELTDYNYEAVGENRAAYGNPWQLIWVFDKNPETKVVCEGYAKAFQYLCDLSGLECYTVNGQTVSAEGSGGHRWNIVRFGEKSYHVDVTWCDGDSVSDRFFLVPATGGSVEEGYFVNDYNSARYVYNEYQYELLGKGILTLATERFDPAAFENQFADIYQSEWYFPYVEYVYVNGLMSGYNEKFSPNENLTKAQVAQVLYNLEGQPEVYDESVFYELSDVYQAEWYANAVAWAYSTGIVTGDLNTKQFAPNANVTREQLALMLYRYADYKTYDISVKGNLSGLVNADKVSDWSEAGVRWAVGMGLISGADKGDYKDLDPQGHAARAQMAAILKRYCEAYE